MISFRCCIIRIQNNIKKISNKKGRTKMADYKAMYLAAMDAMERAIETLTATQQRCEDLYVASSGEEAPLWPQAARPAKEADDA
jgi:hypothetical protein